MVAGTLSFFLEVSSKTTSSIRACILTRLTLDDRGGEQLYFVCNLAKCHKRYLDHIMMKAYPPIPVPEMMEKYSQGLTSGPSLEIARISALRITRLANPRIPPPSCS